MLCRADKNCKVCLSCRHWPRKRTPSNPIWPYVLCWRGNQHRAPVITLPNVPSVNSSDSQPFWSFWFQNREKDTREQNRMGFVYWLALDTTRQERLRHIQVLHSQTCYRFLDESLSSPLCYSCNTKKEPKQKYDVWRHALYYSPLFQLYSWSGFVINQTGILILINLHLPTKHRWFGLAVFLSVKEATSKNLSLHIKQKQLFQQSGEIDIKLDVDVYRH